MKRENLFLRLQRSNASFLCFSFLPRSPRAELPASGVFHPDPSNKPRPALLLQVHTVSLPWAVKLLMPFSHRSQIHLRLATALLRAPASFPAHSASWPQPCPNAPTGHSPRSWDFPLLPCHGSFYWLHPRFFHTNITPRNAIHP